MISGIHYFKDASGEVKTIHCTKDDFKNNPTKQIKCTGARFDDQNNRVNVDNLVIFDGNIIGFKKDNSPLLSIFSLMFHPVTPASSRFGFSISQILER